MERSRRVKGRSEPQPADERSPIEDRVAAFVFALNLGEESRPSPGGGGAPIGLGAGAVWVPSGGGTVVGLPLNRPRSTSTSLGGKCSTSLGSTGTARAPSPLWPWRSGVQVPSLTPDNSQGLTSERIGPDGARLGGPGRSGAVSERDPAAPPGFLDSRSGCQERAIVL